MDVTPRELTDADIREAFRGYNRDEVDDLLERAAATIERYAERVRELGERLANAEQDASGRRETEDMLHRTLLLAQRTADEAVTEARARATQITDEAEARAKALLSDAEASARRVAEAERRRLEHEVHELSSARDRLRVDVDALERFASDYRSRLKQLIEADLAAIAERPVASMPSRPEIADVEIPAGGERVAATLDPSSAPAGDDRSTSAIELGERAELTDAEVSWQAPPPPIPPEPPAIVLDDEPVPAGNREEPEPLDDDAFFATLREAVHDDSPLGPRDDDAPLFDQDVADSSRFGGVFKRRS